MFGWVENRDCWRWLQGGWKEPPVVWIWVDKSHQVEEVEEGVGRAGGGGSRVREEKRRKRKGSGNRGNSCSPTEKVMEKVTGWLDPAHAAPCQKQPECCRHLWKYFKRLKFGSRVGKAAAVSGARLKSRFNRKAPFSSLTWSEAKPPQSLEVPAN